MQGASENLDTRQARLAALEHMVSRLGRRIDILERRSDRYSWTRLAIFIAGLLVSLLLFFLVNRWIGVASEVVSLTVFAIVVTFHQRIERSITRHKISQYLKITQIARMRLDWERIPAVRSPGVPPAHPFAIDLDITGPRSLHQLLNTAVSTEGSQRVCDWLLHTHPAIQVIRKRQALVQELAPLSNFRNKLTSLSLLSARTVADQWEGKKLLAWLGQRSTPRLLTLTLVVAVALAILTLSLFGLNIAGLLPSQFWATSLLLTLLWFFVRREGIGDLFADTTYLASAFGQLSTIFAFLETYPYGKHIHLRTLCEPFFLEHTHRPSTVLKQLSHLAWAATLRKNALLWIVVNAIVPWDIYVAYRFDRLKARVSSLLPGWLDIWFELEALNSLANFAYLNPQYHLPAVTTAASEVLFCAAGLGHPLIAEEQKVVNDFALHHLGEMRIITGSNMSGKSTFLRTLGINLCLAFAGAPVNAASLQTTLFHLFTCIRVSDSVTDGYSYFYAEVKRLKALLDRLEQDNSLPLFFLIDEIFKGTNNRERLLGSQAYIQALVGKQCLGIISTHDLELVKLAANTHAIENYHFREDIIDGSMVFDYLLRPGPCPTTNALKIMQMEGLPVKIFPVEEPR